MCIIISQPAKTHLEKTRAKRLWTKNPDGGGFAFIENGEMQVRKFMAFKPFWAAFEQARSANKKADFLLHMRIKTHGSVTLDNVHPFVVDEHTVMAHNGVITGVPDYKDGRSDTLVFIDEVLPFLKVGWLDDPAMCNMVEKWTGWSRFIFLTKDPALEKTTYILNKMAGATIDGMWFSNLHDVNKPEPKSTHQPSSIGHWTVAGYVGPSTIPKNARPVLPLVAQIPKRGATGQLTETFEKWLVDNNVADGIPPSTGKIDMASIYADIESQRRDNHLLKPIIYDAEFGWSCAGCNEDINPYTGACGCWEQVCIDCERFAAICDCKRGYSTNLVEATSENPAATRAILNLEIT